MESRALGLFFHWVKGHPIHTVLNRIDRVVKDCARGIDEGDLNLRRVQDLGLDLSYMKDLPTTKRTWEAHKRLLERRAVADTKFWKAVYHNCQNPEDLYWSAR